MPEQVRMPPLGPGTARPATAADFLEPAGPPLEDGVRTEFPDDAEVALDRLENVEAVFGALNDFERELVALDEVKGRVREIAALLVVDRLRRSLALEAEPPTLHMCFTGNPGTGKTTVAMRIGTILHALGYVRRGHLVAVTRDELVGQYVGHTAPKTREVIKRAMGGVLFIDEAYTLYRADNERDYGLEAVELLLQVMENSREDLVVVMAGYAHKMNAFFSDVPGLSSRIAHHLDFPDYPLDQLMAIADGVLDQRRYRFSPEGDAAFREYLVRRMREPRFANGRSVRNALDRARMRQAVRLYRAAERGRALTKRDLMTIEAEDILKSRHFQDLRQSHVPQNDAAGMR